MEDFSKILNWNNILKQSENFKNNKPFKFAFVEEFFNRDFYEKLYETYPKIDDLWIDGSNMTKTQFKREWSNTGKNQIAQEGDDPTLSEEWNTLKRYSESKEFIENFKKFSGIPVNKLKNIKFLAYRKGGFQIAHIHNEGPSTLVFMIYFSKNWEKGDPGGTFMASDADEESIIFEPYNLDNTMAVFHDGPKAAHGVRYITKDVERRALQITLEEYSPKTGWSAGDPESTKKEIEQTSIEI